MNAEMIPIIMFIGLFSTISFISWNRSKRSAAATAARAEVYNRMIDKFGSAKDFTDFLQTTEGRSFIEELGRDRGAVAGPYDKILWSVRAGIITLLIGLTLVVLSMSIFDTTEEEMMIPGAMLTALGAGFLISAVISQRLSRSWGILPAAGERA